MRVELLPHPACEPIAVKGVSASLERRSAGSLALGFEIAGDRSRIVLPSLLPPARGDRLWETTCFELFLRPERCAFYREFNFSPSGRWAAYDFSAYRAGMVQACLPAPPALELTEGEGRVIASILLSLDLHQDPYKAGLCAIVEETDGRKSHWALHHGEAAPDFHHPACFDLDLPPRPA